MLKEFFAGIGHFFAAGSFIAKHRLYHYYLLPVLTGILFYVMISALIFEYAGQLTKSLIGDRLPDKMPEFEGYLSFLNFLSSVSIHGLIAVIAGILVFLLSAKFSKYIILIILSPVFSLLSERVEEIITGKQYPFDLFRFLKEMLRGIMMALRNFILEMGLIGLFALAGLFAGPLAILVAPLIWIIGAYFYGFSMLDYLCERRGMTISEGVGYIRKQRYFVLGNGVMYSLFAMIPILGLIVAPIHAVTGACTGILEIEKVKEAKT